MYFVFSLLTVLPAVLFPNIALCTRTLIPYVFKPLPLGSIRPLGWLQGELRALASGLAGHELDFYPYVNDSTWTGGLSEYSHLNEGLPYWFNGLVPLAYSLDDTRLKAQVHAVADHVLSQAESSSDGWIGPEPATGERNFWGRMPFLLGAMQLAQADDAWEERIYAALWRYFGLVNTMLNDGGKGYTYCGLGINDCSWGQARVHDMIITMQWLLETDAGHVNDTETDLLWESMDMLHSLSQYKWEDWYREGTYMKVVGDPTPSNPSFPFLHGVNVGQGAYIRSACLCNRWSDHSSALLGLKSPAVLRRLTGNDSYLITASNAVNWTFEFHGSPSGTILADEIERDLAPWMGSELCTAVETGYSLAYLYQALGRNEFADHAELVIFNAQAVMLTEDAWGHQYMDQPNGPWALNLAADASVFTTSDGAATVFGLEPEYPCCTVNHPQGYPKFLANSWNRADTGLVHALLGPSTVSATVGGKDVIITCATDYPFSNILTYTITSESDIDLFLRLPSWANGSASSVSLNGAVQSAVSADPDTRLHKVSVQSGSSEVVYTLDMPLRVETRSTGAVSVYVGNLLYALDVGSNMSSSLPHRYFDPLGAPTDEFSQYPQARDYYLNNTKTVSEGRQE